MLFLKMLTVISGLKKPKNSAKKRVFLMTFQKSGLGLRPVKNYIGENRESVEKSEKRRKRRLRTTQGGRFPKE
jgi:hypothetical protein